MPCCDAGQEAADLDTQAAAAAAAAAAAQPDAYAKLKRLVSCTPHVPYTSHTLAQHAACHVLFTHVQSKLCVPMPLQLLTCQATAMRCLVTRALPSRKGLAVTVVSPACIHQ